MSSSAKRGRGRNFPVRAKPDGLQDRRVDRHDGCGVVRKTGTPRGLKALLRQGVECGLPIILIDVHGELADRVAEAFLAREIISRASASAAKAVATASSRPAKGRTDHE